MKKRSANSSQQSAKSNNLRRRLTLMNADGPWSRDMAEILPQKAKSGLSGGPGDQKDKTLTLIEKDIGKLTAKER